MRRLVVGAAVLAMAAGGSIGAVGARADQRMCLPEGLPFDVKACAYTDNASGDDGDGHRVGATASENVPTLALGAYMYVDCDDNGGTTDAEFDVILVDPVTVPGTFCVPLP